jgi:hypothetical protein
MQYVLALQSAEQLESLFSGKTRKMAPENTSRAKLDGFAC